MPIRHFLTLEIKYESDLETVRSISGIGVRALRGSQHCTRGPEGTYRWCTSSCANGKRWVAKYGMDNRWKHLSEKPTSRWMLSIRSRQDKPMIGVRCKICKGFSRDVLIDRLILTYSTSNALLTFILFILNKQLKRNRALSNSNTKFSSRFQPWAILLVS